MKIMKLVNNLFKNPCLYYNSFCLIVLLNCGICSTKRKVSRAPDPVLNTSSSNLSDSSTLVSNTNAATSVSNTSTHKPVSNSTPISTSNIKNHDQSSIVSTSNRIVHEQKASSEKYSQELSKIKDLSERDAKIKLIREERNKRIKEFQTLLDKISDANEAKRLEDEFYGTKEMFKKTNLVGSELSDTSLIGAEYDKEYEKKFGDIMEQYNGYYIESKREQITDRVQQLIDFVIKHENSSINRQPTEKLCAICHSGESVTVFPCGDFFHVTCFVEKIISRCRLGPSFYVLQCPGSCGNRIHCLYFLLPSDERAKEYLTSGEWKEIYTPINKK